MSSFTLLHSTGDRHADAVLQSVVERFERAIPQRIVGCYVEGSYAAT